MVHSVCIWIFSGAQFEGPTYYTGDCVVMDQPSPAAYLVTLKSLSHTHTCSEGHGEIALPHAASLSQLDSDLIIFVWMLHLWLDHSTVSAIFPIITTHSAVAITTG